MSRSPETEIRLAFRSQRWDSGDSETIHSNSQICLHHGRRCAAYLFFFFGEQQYGRKLPAEQAGKLHPT